MCTAIHADQLREQIASWSTSEKQDPAPNRDIHSFDPVDCTSCRLNEHSLEIRKVADWIHLLRWIPGVLCASTGSIAAISDYISAKQGLPTNAMEAGIARF